MRDQAEKLRMQMLKNHNALGCSIAVVSGKGGVGKSNFSMNFSSLLVKEGKKVVIVDMDIGMGNIHILIGKTVQASLTDYLEGNHLLDDVICEGPGGLKYISGGSGMTSIVEWSPAMFDKLIEAFQFLQTQFDYILFDMGAGATSWSLQLLTSVDEIIVISTTEPTSIMDAYSMMKYIHLKDSDKTFYLLCNRVFNREEGEETLERLQSVMQRFLSKEVIKLGSLPEDPVVRKSVKEQVPFTTLYPEAPISKTMQKIVLRFVRQSLAEVHPVDEKIGFIGKLKSIFAKGRD